MPDILIRVPLPHAETSLERITPAMSGFAQSPSLSWAIQAELPHPVSDSWMEIVLAGAAGGTSGKLAEMLCAAAIGVLKKGINAIDLSLKRDGKSVIKRIDLRREEEATLAFLEALEDLDRQK
ncbi:MAG TPA: hypothetical protein VGG30_05995 [Pirellulales bacterium]|jgi:hypothetical protein